MIKRSDISCHIGRRVDHQGPRCPVGNQAGNEKYVTGKQLRSKFRIGTWNVRKLKELGKLNTICREMDRNNIEILGVSETNWSNNGSFKTQDNKLVIFSGKDEGSGYSHGVAVIVSKETSRALLGYSPISDRVLKVRFQGKPHNISIIQCYAPTGNASDEEMEEFYNTLQETIDSIPNRDVKIISGDFNAKVGKQIRNSECNGKFGLGEENERGTDLLEFCRSNNLVIANTLFEHHPRHLYTWISPGRKTRNQIDYVIINQKWKASLKNAKTRPGADCNSDHQLLIVDMQFRLKKLPVSETPLKLDYNSIDEAYRVKISNSFEALLVAEEEKSPNELWEDGKKIILSVAKSNIPKKKKKKKQWISNETLREVEKRRLLKVKGINNEVDKAKYRIQNATIQKMMRKDKDKFINEQCQRIEEKFITNSVKDLYAGVKSLTSKFRPSIDTVKDDDGTILCESREVKRRWQDYCTKLYQKNCDIDGPQLPSFVDPKEEPPPLYSEVDKAVKELKNGKSPGVDEIVAELVKNCGDHIVAYFYKLCTLIWNRKEWPDDWVKSIFVPIPKKGDIQQCSNNRTIALICHCSKVILKIIAGRMKSKINEEVNEVQAGFRPGTGTRNQILNLKMIIEKNREYGKNVFLCFIDYRKAFDMVSHSVLWSVMASMGYPAHIIDLLKQLYGQQKAAVRTSHGLTDWFTVEQGVRQGCILSPHLFNIYSEQIMRNALDGFVGSVKVGGRTISNLRYADDVVLIANSMDELQDLVNRVKESSLQFGLALNSNKTKVMKIVKNSQNTKDAEHIIVNNNEIIENVKEFVYLGTLITNNYDDTKEIRRRLCIA